MIQEAVARAQVARLSGTVYYQQRDDAAIEDLVETLRVMADDDYEADEAITYWLQQERECPTVADMRGIFQMIREGKARPEPARVGCGLCKNIGFVIVYQLGTLGRNDKWTFEDIPEAVYQDLKHKLPNNTVDARYSNQRQFVMEGARKCGCRG